MKWAFAFVSLLSVAHAQDLTVSFPNLTPDAALRLAQHTLTSCRAQGFQVAVAVVDRAGVLQVLLRDQLAGAHTVDIAANKAWTAASFRQDTITLARETSDAARGGQRHFPRFVAVGGGIPVTARGSLVGAVAVSGAPGGEADHKCASDGVAAIQTDLDF